MIIHAYSNTAHVSIPQAAIKSLNGFRAWVYSDDFPDEGKYTYFQTEVLLDMAAERANSHAEVKTEITSVLKSIVRERDLGKIYGDGPPTMRPRGRSLYRRRRRPTFPRASPTS